MRVLVQNLERNITNTAEPIFLYHNPQEVEFVLRKTPSSIAGRFAVFYVFACDAN